MIVLSCREGMLEFFGSHEKLDKAGILMKTEDSLHFQEVSSMRYLWVLVGLIACQLFPRNAVFFYMTSGCS